MQTVKGTVAKNPTWEEVRELLQSCYHAVITHPDWPAGWKPIFSVDNAQPHHKAVNDPRPWKGPGRPDVEFTFVPPTSPDIHQAIEHAHANGCAKFKKQLLERAMGHTPYANISEVVKELQACFQAANTPASILKNCQKLHTRTYPEIIRPEGAWPSCVFR